MVLNPWIEGPNTPHWCTHLAQAELTRGRNIIVSFLSCLWDHENNSSLFHIEWNIVSMLNIVELRPKGSSFLYRATMRQPNTFYTDYYGPQ